MKRVILVMIVATFAIQAQARHRYNKLFKTCTVRCISSDNELMGAWGPARVEDREDCDWVADQFCSQFPGVVPYITFEELLYMEYQMEKRAK